MSAEKHPARVLVAISFVSLFLELALIRFINSTVQVIAYFNNFLIISAFLGLGFGSYLVPRKRDLFQIFPPIMAGVIALMVYLDFYGFTSDLSDQVFWAAISVKQNLPAPFVVILVFFANFVFFVPLGYKLGTCLNLFEDRLQAYGFDLLGSFLGVVGFGVFSYLRLQPWAWFSFSGILIFLLLSKTSRMKIATSAALLLAAVLLALVPETGIWSPYYKVTLHPYRPETLGYSIRVDKVRIQDALHFSEELERSGLGPWISYYRLPYHFVRPRTLLILGGGAGNDAAVALNFQSKRICVVEIDPVLVQLGYTIHPHTPYRNSTVHVITDDARSFLRRNHENFDMILMNALDSHHQLPGLSTLRLESYIYTVEAFKDVRKHMRKDSVFVIHLGSTRKWMGERLYWSLTEAFGQEPRLFTTRDSPFGSIAFVYGPPEVLQRASRAGDVLRVDPSQLRAAKPETELSTDDWPHLYLADKKLPLVYLYILGIIVLVTGLIFFRSLARIAENKGLHFLLLGAGFMLLETRSITKSALLFGSTWITNAVVIASILFVVWLGNLLISKNLHPRKSLCYVGLISSLILGYLVSIDFILNFPFVVRILVAGIWLALPIFFASFIFSLSFRNVSTASAAFGSNLFGVVIGGVLEYSSMIYGLNILYLLAALIYILAAFAG